MYRADRWVGGAHHDSADCNAEVTRRVASVHAVTKAMTAGVWPLECESLDALSDILASASRWRLAAEMAE